MVTPLRGPPSASSVSTAPGSPASATALAGMDRHGARGADARVDVQRREASRGEQHELGEVVVEPRPAAAADDGDAARAEAERVLQRELEIGRVLVGRVALDADARRLGRAHRPGARRVQITDEDVDASPSAAACSSRSRRRSRMRRRAGGRPAPRREQGRR